MPQNLDSGVNAEDLEASFAAACEAPVKKTVEKPAAKEATAPKKTSKSNKSNA